MTDTPETPDTPAVEVKTTLRTSADLPLLLDSIAEKLSDLVQHAANHAYRDGVNGVPRGVHNAPECILEHIAELSRALWTLAPADQFDRIIVLPREMPAGLRAQTEAAVQTVEAGDEIPTDVLDQMGAFVRDAVAGRKAGERR